jgi:hypothetical protein
MIADVTYESGTTAKMTTSSVRAQRWGTEAPPAQDAADVALSLPMEWYRRPASIISCGSCALRPSMTIG